MALQGLVDHRCGPVHLLARHLVLQLVDRGDDAVDDLLSQLESLDHLLFGEFLSARLHHVEAGLVGGHDEVQARLFATALIRREGAQLAIEVTDAHRAQGRLERHATDAHSGKGRDHRAHVGVGRAVVRQRVAHDLHFARELVREQRTDGAVDETHGQRLLGGRTAFALEEAAGDLARGFGLLAVVHRQREEVDVVALRADARGRKAHRAAEGGDHGAVGLTGDLPSLQHQSDSADGRLHSDREGMMAHSYCFLFVSRYVSTFVKNFVRGA